MFFVCFIVHAAFVRIKLMMIGIGTDAPSSALSQPPDTTETVSVILAPDINIWTYLVTYTKPPRSVCNCLVCSGAHVQLDLYGARRSKAAATQAAFAA